MIKEQQKTDTDNLDFNCSETPGLYEITDLDQSETIGYIGYFMGDVTFYPKAGQAYSAAAISRITQEIMRHKKEAELRARGLEEKHNSTLGPFESFWLDFKGFFSDDPFNKNNQS